MHFLYRFYLSLFLLFLFPVLSIPVFSLDTKETEEIGQLETLPLLGDLPVFSSEELENFKRSSNFPSEEGEEGYEVLSNIFYSYDYAQPTREFKLRKKFKVASFNITRGYSLEKLKLVFKENIVFENMIAEYPELDCVETFEQALDATNRQAKKENLDPFEYRKAFYNYLDELLDSDNSQLPEIINPEAARELFSGEDRYKNTFELAKQIYDLSKADAIALQEVDWGMPRTEYKHIVKEIAEETGMGYAYGVEFIELLDEGIPYSFLKEPVNEELFRGFHGNAILSKWPLENIRVLRYKEAFTEDSSMSEMKHRRCYDWWREELPKLGPFERVIGTGMKILFDERAIPSLRLGSRMALMADLETPEGKITFTSTHIENRGNEKCRRAELKDLLLELKETTPDFQPVVIGGDMNTTSEEARRPYFRHAVYWYIRNQFDPPVFAANVLSWIGTVGLVKAFQDFPIPLPGTVQFLNQLRKWRNPPGMLTREKKFFRETLEDFVFYDQTVFDTRGQPTFNWRNSTRMLSNSNETTPIGYKPTYCFTRNYKEIFCMKLDWIFVKNNLDWQTREATTKDYADNSWAPTNPRSLYELSVTSSLSDHGAITTDLMLPSSNELEESGTENTF